MTKNKLIKELKKIKGNPKIIVSSDAEGNSFGPLYQISDGLKYDPENREILDEEDAYEETGQNLQKCIVLWPS